MLTLLQNLSVIHVKSYGQKNLLSDRYSGVRKRSESQFSTAKMSEKHVFRVPSPFMHRRQRTVSVTEAAAQTPVLKGVIKDFCKERGHGFVVPADGSTDLFVHISDIDEEYVPIPGDEVTYQKCLTPPKNESYQAVHVKITHLKEGEVHHRWDGSIAPTQ